MAKATHKMSNTKIYKSWKAMRQRCSNPNHISYKNYGGRGITVCDEWNDFDTFYKDMGDRPRGATLDRIDNDKGYSKENCEWKTWCENNRNKRSNKYIVVDGEPKAIVEVAEMLNVSPQTLYSRVQNGWSNERILKEKPFKGNNQHTRKGVA